MQGHVPVIRTGRGYRFTGTEVGRNPYLTVNAIESIRLVLLNYAASGIMPRNGQLVRTSMDIAFGLPISLFPYELQWLRSV